MEERVSAFRFVIPPISIFSTIFKILDEFSAMASKIDQKCNENGVDFVEMDIANDCIDPAIGSVINSIIFGYRFGKVVTVTCLSFAKEKLNKL